jgi:hypothetical protein
MLFPQQASVQGFHALAEDSTITLYCEKKSECRSAKSFWKLLVPSNHYKQVRYVFLLVLPLRYIRLLDYASAVTVVDAVTPIRW